MSGNGASVVVVVVLADGSTEKAGSVVMGVSKDNDDNDIDDAVVWGVALGMLMEDDLGEAEIDVAGLIDACICVGFACMRYAFISFSSSNCSSCGSRHLAACTACVYSRTTPHSVESRVTFAPWVSVPYPASTALNSSLRCVHERQIVGVLTTLLPGLLLTT